jgi:hypothetical protein
VKFKDVDCDVVSEVIHHIPHFGPDRIGFGGPILLSVTMAAGD